MALHIKETSLPHYNPHRNILNRLPPLVQPCRLWRPRRRPPYIRRHHSVPRLRVRAQTHKPHFLCQVPPRRRKRPHQRRVGLDRAGLGPAHARSCQKHFRASCLWRLSRHQGQLLVGRVLAGQELFAGV